MPAARGVKRSASKASGSAPTKIKKKHGVQLEVPARSRLRGKVLACGQNDVGQLGLGEDVTETTKFKVVSTLGENIVDVCAGGMHTVALDSDGKVWTFGCNDENALGRSGEEYSVGCVDLPGAAVAISAGDSHTAALLDTGDVYLWGSFRDSHGSMGLVVSGREGKTCAAPVRAPLPEPVAAIASGGDHLVLLTKSGAVYTCGCGEQGQLGRLAQRSASRHARSGLSVLLQPTAVTLKTAVSRVWAGSHATFALPADRPSKMLAWGLNNHNQLGVTGEKKRTAIYAPVDADAFAAVDDVETWTQVSCGQHHSLAVDDSGRCYAVGRHDYGRLGLGEGSGDTESLALIPKLKDKKCVSIAAAQCSSFAVTDNGEVYAWGMGSEGQLGTGCEADEVAPRLVTANIHAPHRVVKVSAGGQHAVLLAVNTEAGESEPEVAAAATDKKDETKPSKSRGAQKQASEDKVQDKEEPEAMEVDAQAAPQKKLNGEEDTAAPMDTDETDKPQDETTVEKNEKPEIKPETEPETKPEAKPGVEPAKEEENTSMDIEPAKPQEPVPAEVPAKEEEPRKKDETTKSEPRKEEETNKSDPRMEEDTTKSEPKVEEETTKLESRMEEETTKLESRMDEESKLETDAKPKETESAPLEIEPVSKEAEVTTKVAELAKTVETSETENAVNGESETANKATEKPIEEAKMATEVL